MPVQFIGEIGQSPQHPWTTSVLSTLSAIRHSKFRHLVKQLSGSEVVWGRLACLGNEVVSRVKPTAWICNQQKTRVDLFCRWKERQARPSATAIRPHLARTDILNLIRQQETLPWLNCLKRPDILVMDSFSELTDQEFRHKVSGWSFCSHYSDIDHTGEFDRQFECLGLLPIDQIAASYEAFFAWLDRTDPCLPVVFLHFPTALDGRAKFHQRSEAILDAIEAIGRNREDFLSIQVPAESVRPADDDSFAYHFNPETFQAFADQWSQRSLACTS